MILSRRSETCGVNKSLSVWDIQLYATATTVPATRAPQVRFVLFRAGIGECATFSEFRTRSLFTILIYTLCLCILRLYCFSVCFKKHPLKSKSPYPPVLYTLFSSGLKALFNAQFCLFHMKQSLFFDFYRLIDEQQLSCFLQSLFWTLRSLYFLSSTFQGAYTLFRDSSDKFDKDDCLTWRPKRWCDIFAAVCLKVNNGSLVFNGITFARKKRNGNYKSAFISSLYFTYQLKP